MGRVHGIIGVRNRLFGSCSKHEASGEAMSILRRRPLRRLGQGTSRPTQVAGKDLHPPRAGMRPERRCFVLAGSGNFCKRGTMTAIREITKVKVGGVVEIATPGLPPGEEVEVIVLAGMMKAPPPLGGRRLRADWGGALADLGRQYTSVELQHKAKEWWGD